eukprot:TRINITY_DN5833_c0_g2_i1.p1 TRINITY_DN5833_c0_g2~~TRINITY_DN5833_c0_g2_i1.p1  ORF type:complete len:322 (-),score=90.10 TRINITY_DN5833_c0_g2_i1:56-1021(-)
MAAAAIPFQNVVVHPLVLLSTVDHYTRVAKDLHNKRVVGVLLGHVHRGVVDVMNGFAVPSDDDENDPSVWFFDHTYLENMFNMFRKVNARESIVGWYSTGPKIRPCDIKINEVMRRFTPNPVFVIIDVQPKTDLALPIQAYVGVEEISEEIVDGAVKPIPRMKFRHMPSDVGTVDAEEVGVEHLLRDIQDTTVGNVSVEIGHKLAALRSLQTKIQDMKEYLENVVSGRLPVNQRIVQQIQDIFNLVPNLNAGQYAKSFAVKSNDMLLAIYLSSVIRSVIALHDLVLNKMEYKDAERRIDTEAAAPAPAQSQAPAPAAPTDK